ncbi:MAG: PH domain-containing protein [Rhodospirillales bacterium]
MADFVVYPTKKWLRLQYTTTFIVVCVAVFLYVNFFQELPAWLLVFPALLFLWPISGSIQLRFTKIVVTGDKLRFETGILSKCTRTIQIQKIQNVTVNQNLFQRLHGVGDISIETSGESSQLTVRNIDDPQELADWLVESAQAQPQTHSQKRKVERA